MTVLRESPWYQEILQEGEKRGEQRGEKRGEKRGEQRLRKGLLSGIALGLELKFGHEGLQLLPDIRALESVDQLELIQEALATASTLEDLRQLY